MTSLHVITVGSPDSASLESVHCHFEVVITTVEAPPGQFSWERVADPVNRAIDEATGWILLVREGERVSPALANEIARLAVEKPGAWAYRIPVATHYGGSPLYRGGDRSGGEIRLFHSRRCRFLPKGNGRELQSRGTVIRIAQPLERPLYVSFEEHRAKLSALGVPHSLVRRVLVFLSRVWGDRRRLNRRTIRYHWIEAGWDRDSISGESSGDRN